MRQQAAVSVGPSRAAWLRAWAFLCLLALCALLAGRHANAATEADFLDPEKAFAFSATMTAPDTLELRYKVAPGYYMYRERFALAADPAQPVVLGDPIYPQGEVKHDPTFDKEMEVYHRDLAIRVPLAAGAQGPLTITVTSQGCADAGLCYPPMDHAVKLVAAGTGYAIEGRQASSPEQGAGLSLAQSSQGSTPAVAGTGATAPADTSLGSLLHAGDVGLAGALSGLGWLKTAGVFLLLGLLLAFTPCVLPMIPILSSVVLGGAQRPSRWRGLGLAAAYVLGMSVVYTALGVAAGLSGAGLAAWLQTPWVRGLFALLLAVLALAMFDAFTFQMPSGVQARLAERSNRIPGGRVTGAVLMGAVSALIVGPCVAAPLAGALLYISQTGDVLLGGSALFALAWGMGVPLLLVGASAGTLLPRTGPWMEGVKRLFGLLLLATAWWMVIPIVPTWAQMLGWAFLAIVGAVMLRAFDALPQGAGAARMFGKGLGLLLALAAAAWLVGAVSGGRDVLQPLAHLAARESSGGMAAAGAAPEARFQRVRSNAELDALLASSSRPVMLDFYADWCISCKEMERFTFTDPQVAARMAGMVLVQADVTQNNADDRALLKRFKLFGPPGIMFFAPGGRELTDVRVIGFQDARRFAATLEKVSAR
ncbi:thiol:disulfide interchange protein [Bordetella ansorpii]|uniref:Thiol:disulfide interchange protein DsbD n=1 Tax=Bordetella ansorpii TaxID=288768 RepID=A0A157PWB4_9BORD|nr:protein-disulfide reductase DsbD [Bordetella ansorpii]SAI37678.1 thiol:disulfide interchange protein [Bordetella ansorpii]